MTMLRIPLFMLLSLLTLTLGTLSPAVQAATRSSTPATPCATYQATPHGGGIPATFTCIAHHEGSITPDTLGYPDCHGYTLVLYEDSDYKGGSLCFGPGDYNLTDFQFCRGFFFGCTTANDQMSSYRNNSGQWGYMSTDINGGGDTFWFAPNQAVNYVGTYFNDQISFVHVD